MIAPVTTIVKALFQDTLPYDHLRVWHRGRHLEEWIRRGKPAPPPHIVKQLALRSAAARSGKKVLVETGTYDGDMAYAMKDTFAQIITIELFEPLYRRAKRRFARYPNITCVLGDSAVKLPEVLSQLKAGAVFWLDGHFSGVLEGKNTGRADKETPIIEELRSIASHHIKDHAILIDDARCFTGEHDYPTITWLKQFVSDLFPGRSFEVADDSIRIF
ncbi:MAG TPA: hypothetical protein VN700_11030 [Vicinamibacterales bacterium]|nr:hypothetical protein [Vicinamibacterales bacterium]